VQHCIATVEDVKSFTTLLHHLFSPLRKEHCTGAVHLLKSSKDTLHWCTMAFHVVERNAAAVLHTCSRREKVYRSSVQ
jgi:hypothetical protein